jgi:predicted GNAT family N-acyltransferase
MGAGVPIGEIGFLRGVPATATVTTKTHGSAFVIDDSAFHQLEHEQPVLIAEFLRTLAQIADERTTYNLTQTPESSYAAAPTMEILLCRSKDMLRIAQRLRYEVYCEELGRKSPYADPEKKIITDDLDEFGHIFLAVEADEMVGTLRVNSPSEGSLGVLEELYGMRASANHPDATVICTKFIVKKSRRRSPAAIKLISAATKYGVRSKWKECFIDCIPALLPYYKAMGFRIAGPRFFHRENGPSLPMKLDVSKHAPKLTSEFGRFKYLNLYVKAKAIKLIDDLIGSSVMTEQP